MDQFVQCTNPTRALAFGQVEHRGRSSPTVAAGVRCGHAAVEPGVVAYFTK